jgi:hypothetical protein
MRPRLLNRALAVAAGALLTTTLAACESTEHESAQLEQQSRAAQAAELAKERAERAHAHGAHEQRSHGKSSTSARGAAKG